MHAVDALRRLGGVATRSQLLGLLPRSAVDRALLSGDIVRDARGAYALPIVPAAIRAASAHRAAVSHRSAALGWGWELKADPPLPELIVPRNRNVPRGLRAEILPHWADLRPDEVDGLLTSRDRTLVDCLSTLPGDEGLSVADSALRHGDVTSETLRLLTSALTGPGSSRARHIAQLADGRAANPFESVLRWIAAPIKGLDVVPQVESAEDGFFARPDLVDVERRIVFEPGYVREQLVLLTAERAQRPRRRRIAA